MKFDDETRARLPLKIESELDLSTATVEMKVAGVWRAATWESPATKVGAKWTRLARTVDYFAGSASVAQPGDVVLTGASRLTQGRVTSGGDQIVVASTPIDVT